MFVFPNHNNTYSSNNQKSSRFPPRLRASLTKAPTLLPHSAIQRIADKLRTLGFDDQQTTPPPDSNGDSNSNSNDLNSPGRIFVPLPSVLPKYRVGHTFDPSWSTPENPVPQPGTGTAIRRHHQLRNEVLVEEEKLKRRRRVVENNVPCLAELKLSSDELKRLRSDGIKLKQKLKVGKAGITEGIVNGIHERWRHTELVKIKCDDICSLNMKRTHDLLEVRNPFLFFVLCFRRI